MKTQKKAIYYIGILDITSYNPIAEEDKYYIEDLMKNFFTEKEIVELGIWFSCEGSDSSSVDNLDGAVHFSKMSDAITTYIFSYEDYLLEEEDMELEDIIKQRVSDFENKQVFVLRKYKTENKIKIIPFKEIESTILSIIQKSENSSLDFNKFFDKIEKTIEGDFCHVSLASSFGVYDLGIMKKGGFSYNRFKKEKHEFSKNSERNDFMYENGLTNLINWFLVSFAKSPSIIGCTINAPIANADIYKMLENKKRVLRKVYAIEIFVLDNKINLKGYTAEKVLESYTIHNVTKEKINPDKNFIYCNIDNKKDVICGFDLIKE